MNELLQKFARQVGFGSDKNGEIYTSALEHLPITEDLDAFAELIVKECADLCDRFQARDVGMQPAECAGAIRSMFGVER